MYSEHKLYLEQLEAELAILKVELARCLQEEDYEYAGHNQRAINKVEFSLRMLRKLCPEKNLLDEQHIDDAIIELNENRIKNFAILLHPHQDFYLSFKKITESEIYCELPSKDELLNAYSYGYSNMYVDKKLNALGFVKNPERNERFGMSFIIPPNNSCVAIKTTIALLLYDIFQIPTGVVATLVKQ